MQVTWSGVILSSYTLIREKSSYKPQHILSLPALGFCYSWAMSKYKLPHHLEKLKAQQSNSDYSICEPGWWILPRHVILQHPWSVIGIWSMRWEILGLVKDLTHILEVGKEWESQIKLFSSKWWGDYGGIHQKQGKWNNCSLYWYYNSENPGA